MTCYKRLRNEKCVKDWALYLAKAIVLVGLLFICKHFIVKIPPVLVGILLAAFVGFSTFGVIYHITIKKYAKQLMYKEGSMLANFNGGRILMIVIWAIISAVGVITLLLNVVEWKRVEWIAVAISVVAYIGVSWMVNEVFSKKEYEPEFQMPMSIKISRWIIGALLTVSVFLIMNLNPVTSTPSMVEILNNAHNPFEGTSSVLLFEIGEWSSRINAFKEYGFLALKDVNYSVFAIVQVLVSAAAFFTFANMLGTCAIGCRESKIVFQKLEALKNPEKKYGIEIGYAGTLAACILAVCIGFPVIDGHAPQVVNSKSYIGAEKTRDDAAKKAAYFIDGKYVDKDKLDVMKGVFEGRVRDISKKAKQDLLKAINQTYDGREGNVDKYLDWYYDSSRYGEIFVNDVIFGRPKEQYLKEGFLGNIDAGIDSAMPLNICSKFENDIEAIKSLYGGVVAALELSEEEKGEVLESKEVSKSAVFANTLNINVEILSKYYWINETPVGESVLQYIPGLNTVINLIKEKDQREEFKSDIINELQESRKEALEAIGGVE